VLLDETIDESAPNSAIQPGEILSFPPGEKPQLANSVTLQSLSPDAEVPSVFLADLWIYYNPDKTARLFEISTASDYTLEAFRSGETVNRPLYNDEQFGRWISTYVPLKDEDGITQAILGVDFEADYVYQVQAAIRNRVLAAFLLAYAALFALVYFLSNIFSKPLTHLTSVAEQIGEGNYNHDFKIFDKARLPDEISILANVFRLMMDKVRQREENLKQQVAQLKIEIDESKRDNEVNQITESEFFQDLRAKVIELRQRRGLHQEDKLDKEQTDQPEK
jgi:methyl-accepting chemotaxis protein